MPTSYLRSLKTEILTFHIKKLSLKLCLKFIYSKQQKFTAHSVVSFKGTRDICSQMPTK